MIYKPKTDIGEDIASALKYDDGVRLKIHEILEEWEPKYIALQEKAEAYDRVISKHLDKLEAVTKWHEEWFRHTGSHFPKLWKILEDKT